MTRMTGPDCVVMCNLINTHTHTHTIVSLILFEYLDYARLKENHYSNILEGICYLVILLFRFILSRMM